MGIIINDVLGIGKTSPIKKLINVVCSATGKFTKDYFERKAIDTKVIEIQQITQAINQNPINNGTVKYEDGKLAISANYEQNQLEKSKKTISERAESRANFKEEQKQLNIESITIIAAEALQNETEVTDEPLDKDWTTRFFNIAEDVSNEEMQALWGRILAGEIKKPKSYSLRTLELLKNMSKDEAECFSKVGKLAIISDEIDSQKAFLLKSVSDNKEFFKEKYGLYFDDILLLNELGIITNSIGFSMTGPQVNFLIGEYFICITKEDRVPEIRLSVYGFTNVGYELLQLITKNVDFDFIKFFTFNFRKEGVKIKYGIVESIEEMGIKTVDDLIDVPL